MGAWLAAGSANTPPVGLRKSMDGARTDVTDVSTFVYYPIDNAVPAAWRGRLGFSSIVNGANTGPPAMYVHLPSVPFWPQAPVTRKVCCPSERQLSKTSVIVQAVALLGQLAALPS